MSPRILFLCIVAWSVNLGANDVVLSASFIQKTKTSITDYNADSSLAPILTEEKRRFDAFYDGLRTDPLRL